MQASSARPPSIRAGFELSLTTARKQNENENRLALPFPFVLFDASPCFGSRMITIPHPVLTATGKT